MHRESGYERYKEPEGVGMSARKAIGIQLYGAAHTAVTRGLMRAVTLRGQNTIILWRLTFVSSLICCQFKHYLPVVLLDRLCLPSWSFIHNVQCRRLYALIFTEQKTILFCCQNRVTCKGASVLCIVGAVSQTLTNLLVSPWTQAHPFVMPDENYRQHNWLLNLDLIVFSQCLFIGVNETDA